MSAIDSTSNILNCGPPSPEAWNWFCREFHKMQLYQVLPDIRKRLVEPQPEPQSRWSDSDSDSDSDSETTEEDEDSDETCSDCLMRPYLAQKCKDLFAPTSDDELDNLFSIAEESKYIDIKPYSHNIVSIALRILDEQYHYDDEKMKLVIKTFKLDKKGWTC